MPWQWPFRAAPCNWGCPQECYAGWYRSSANVWHPSWKKGCLIKLDMLDVVEKDPEAPTPASAPSSPTPDPEEEEVIQTPEEACTLEPEETAHSEEELTLVQGQYPARPLGCAHSLVTQTCAS